MADYGDLPRLVDGANKAAWNQTKEAIDHLGRELEANQKGDFREGAKHAQDFLKADAASSTLTRLRNFLLSLIPDPSNN